MEKLKKAFRVALLTEMNEPKTQRYIRKIVSIRLAHSPEYRNPDETAHKCMSHIFEVVDKQLNESEGYSNRERFLYQKLINMQVRKGYVQKYIMTAANTYCTAKQVKCNPGREAIVDDKGNVIQKAIKQGKASRAIDGHDKLEWIISSDAFTSSNISDDAIADTEQYLKKLHLNEKEIRCFWDRLEGDTFVDMAKEYQEGNAKKEKSAPDLYRKRYKRLMEKIGNKNEKVFDLMTRDSHVFQNHALNDS
ncbi:MAG: hypothetical protein ACI88H_000703 [Cocleimonas sp.]|jgi:hypothetical protein